MLRFFLNFFAAKAEKVSSLNDNEIEPKIKFNVDGQRMSWVIQFFFFFDKPFNPIN